MRLIAFALVCLSLFISGCVGNLQSRAIEHLSQNYQVGVLTPAELPELEQLLSGQIDCDDSPTAVGVFVKTPKNKVVLFAHCE